MIHKAYMDGIYVQSDFSRTHVQAVCAAASLGLITTRTSDGSFGRIWRPTHQGYLWVNERGIE